MYNTVRSRIISTFDETGSLEGFHEERPTNSGVWSLPNIIGTIPGTGLLWSDETKMELFGAKRAMRSRKSTCSCARDGAIFTPGLTPPAEHSVKKGKGQPRNENMSKKYCYKNAVVKRYEICDFYVKKVRINTTLIQQL